VSIIWIFSATLSAAYCNQTYQDKVYMPTQEASDRSAISIVFAFAVSVCLAMFSEERLHSIQALVSDLADRHREGMLASVGLYDVNLAGVLWDVVLAAAAVYWLGKLFHSPVSRVFAALLGASIGCWIGLHH